MLFVNLPVREGPRTVCLDMGQEGPTVSGEAIFNRIGDSLGLPSSSFVVSHCGRPLSHLDRVPSSAFLDVYPKICGGGGDGGSTGAESRSCYLEMYQGKRKDKVRGHVSISLFPSSFQVRRDCP